MDARAPEPTPAMSDETRYAESRGVEDAVEGRSCCCLVLVSVRVLVLAFAFILASVLVVVVALALALAMMGDNNSSKRRTTLLLELVPVPDLDTIVSVTPPRFGTYQCYSSVFAPLYVVSVGSPSERSACSVMGSVPCRGTDALHQ
jgi:hypothetical protein